MHRNPIDGRFVEAPDAGRIPVFDPARETRIAEISGAPPAFTCGAES